MDKIEKKILSIIDENSEKIMSFGRDIYTHAELGFREWRTSEKFLEFVGPFSEKIEKNLAITGVKAYLNCDRGDNFSLAMIGEMDGLPIPDQECSNKETGAAHACGHHAQITAVAGAMLALSDSEVKDCLGGQLVAFGVPAEEHVEQEYIEKLISEGKIKTAGGKCELIAEGAFKDIDACLAHHMAIWGVRLGRGSGNGTMTKNISIIGKTAHAGISPEEGINALSAANIGIQALAMNRETFRDEDSVRVQPVIKECNANISAVPGRAEVEVAIRAKTLDAIKDTAMKVDRSFKAGAMAMGADIEIETIPGYLPTKALSFPVELVEGVKGITEKFFVANPSEHSGGATDFGDVQHFMPVWTFHAGGYDGWVHQPDFKIVDEYEAYIVPAKIFAISAYRLLKDDAKLGKREVENYEAEFKTVDEYLKFKNIY